MNDQDIHLNVEMAFARRLAMRAHQALHGRFDIGERVAEYLEVPCARCCIYAPLLGTRFGPLCTECREHIEPDQVESVPLPAEDPR